MNRELYTAVENNYIAKAEQLLQKGGDVNYLSSYTLLTKAVSLSNLAMCQLLIEHGADIDKKDSTCYPIHEAAEKNNVDILALLISKGADLNVKKGGNETALRIACEKSHFDTVLFLLFQENIQCGIKDEDGKTALEVSSNEDIKTVIKQRVSCGLEQFIADFSQSNFSKENVLLKKYEADYEKSKLQCNEKFEKYQKYIKTVNHVKIANFEKLIQMEGDEISNIEAEICLLGKKIDELRSKKIETENEKLKLTEKKEFLEKSVKAKEVERKMSFTYNEQTFECCVCLSIPYAPKKVMSCKNGHCVCDGCKQTLQVCPICRVDISNAVRNLVVERLLAESQPVAESV